MRSARGGALVLASLAAVVALTFAEALAGSRAFYQRDIHAYWYPHMAAFRRAIAEGSWPLWNPWAGFGSPLLADATFQLAYPPTWLALVLEPSVQFKVLTIGHCLLAALGAGALARRAGLGWAAAGTAGTAYGVSGPLLSAASLFHHFAGAAWLPWLLFVLEGLVRRPALAAALPLGLVAGAQLLAGSGEMCLAGALLGAARLAWHLVRRRPPLGRILALGGSGTAAAALALALGAVQWLPTAERARDSFRAALDPRTNAYWSLHPGALADLLVPRLATDLPLSEPARQALFEGREPFLACLYLGVVPLALGGLGLALRPRLAAPPAAGALFLILVALGRHTPVFGLLLGLPGFGVMRYPQKFLWPAALCVALLAALGTEAWVLGWSATDRRRARRTAALLIAATAAALLAAWWVVRPPGGLTPYLGADEPAASLAARTAALKLARSAILALILALLLWRRAAGPQAGRAATAVLLLLGAADLVAVGRGVNPLAPRELLDDRPPVVSELREGEARLHAANEGPSCLAPGTSPPGWRPAWIAARGFQETLRPPASVRWGLRGSYDGDFTGLGSRWNAPFTSEAWSRLGTPAGLRLLQIGGVTHVLRVGGSPVPGLDLLETRPSPYVCPLQIFRVPDPLPGAYVARGERRGGDPGAVLRILLDPGFDPRSEVVLEDARPAASVVPGPDEVRVVSRRLGALAVDARLSAPGVLVVLEAFDSGWRARVDGVQAPVLRANGLFRAVRLPEGRHRVLLTYRSRSAAVGAGLSLLGLAAAGAAFGVRARGREWPAAIAGAPHGG
jgi:hypothetical protein